MTDSSCSAKNAGLDLRSKFLVSTLPSSELTTSVGSSLSRTRD